MRPPFSLGFTTLQRALIIGTIPLSLLTARAQESLIPHGDIEIWAAAKPEEEKFGVNLPDGLPDKTWLVFYPNKAVAGVPEDADGYTLARDTEVKVDGEASLRIEGAKDTADFGVHFMPVKVDPGNKYRITMMIKGEDIHPNPKLNSKHAGAFIRWQAGSPKSYWGGEGQLSGSATLSDEIREGTFDWTPVEMEVQAADDTETLGFRVILQASTGKLWVDNIKIETVSN